MIHTRLLLFPMFLLTIAAWTSCSKDESPDTTPDNAEEVTDTDFMRFAEVASILYDVDFSDTLLSEYPPLYGEVLDATAPTAYSIGLNNADEAKEWFITHCVPLDEQDSIRNALGNGTTLNFGSYGTITYRHEGSSTRYGRIKLDLQNVTAQQTIDLIPMTLWPNNYSSHFYVGNVVYDHTLKRYFLCVRACEGGQLGLLLNFGELHEFGLGKIEYHDWWKDDFSLPEGASEEAWAGYAQMYWDNEDNFRALIKDIKRKVPDFNLDHYQAMSELIDRNDTGKSYRYACGQPWGQRELWLFRKVWNLHQKYIYIGKKELKMENGMPRFRTETFHVADDDWWSIPSYYPHAISKTFNNDASTLEQFTLKYDGDF